MKRAAAAIQLPATRTAMRAPWARNGATGAATIATTTKTARRDAEGVAEPPACARTSSTPFHAPFQSPSAAARPATTAAEKRAVRGGEGAEDDRQGGRDDGPDQCGSEERGRTAVPISQAGGRTKSAVRPWRGPAGPTGATGRGREAGPRASTKRCSEPVVEGPEPVFMRWAMRQGLRQRPPEEREPGQRDAAPARRRAVRPAGQRWMRPIPMPVAWRQAGRDHEADAVEERRLRRRAAPCRGRGRGRSRRSRRAAAAIPSFGRASKSTAAPRPIAESAMPTSMPGSFTPRRPSVPPKAMTIGNVTGSSHMAGGPSWAPQSPTAIMASTWSSPDTGCASPARNPVASPPRVWARARREQQSHASSRSESARAAKARRRPRSRSPPEEDGRALDRPEGAERADGVARQRLDPARPPDLEQRGTSARGARTSRTNPTWPISTPTLKPSSASGRSAPGQPRARQRRSAKPKPWSRPKTKATTQGCADREARLAPPGADDLGAEEEDARARSRRSAAGTGASA